MKSLKINVLGAIVGGTLLASGLTSKATDASNAPPRKPLTSPEERRLQVNLDQLTHDLNLTADQASKVKTVLQAHEANLEALRSSTFPSPEVRRDKIKSAFAIFSDKMKAVLTPAQFDKWQVLSQTRSTGQ